VIKRRCLVYAQGRKVVVDVKMEVGLTVMGTMSAERVAKLRRLFGSA